MPVYPGAPESETEPAIGTREGCQRPASPGRKCQTFVLSHFRDARCGCPECGPCRPGPLARRGRPGSDGGGHSSHQGQAGTRCHTTESGMELGYRPVGPDEAPVPDQSSRDGLPERRPRGRRQRQEACTGTIRRAHHPVRKRVCDRPSGHDDAAASGLDLTFRPQVRSPEHLSFLGRDSRGGDHGRDRQITGRTTTNVGRRRSARHPTGRASNHTRLRIPALRSHFAGPGQTAGHGVLAVDRRIHRQRCATGPAAHRPRRRTC